MASGRGFLSELKRRHVWRVAIAYVLVSWVLVQVATQVFPFFGIPDWVVRLVVVLLVLGFPVALVLAWVFELMPEGIRRTEPLDSPDARSEHERKTIRQKLNITIITVLLLAVALLGWQVVTLRERPLARGLASSADAAQAPGPIAATGEAPVASVSASSVRSASATPAPAERSLAVLPFSNQTGGKEQQFFSDGLSQDLITALSQFASLKVISRQSAFQFRDSAESSTAIGKKLGVAYLLEGNVQRDGEAIRVIAALVSARDGQVIWSQRYDKPYTDLFALQDAITGAVADALEARLLDIPGAVIQSERPPSGNLAAYVAYQQGTAYYNLGTEAGDRRALAAFGEAIGHDPGYVAAHASLSEVWGALAGQFMDGPQASAAYARAREAADTAVRLDPRSAAAHRARAMLLLNADMDWSGAQAEARRALRLAPNDPAAQAFLGSTQASLGQLHDAVKWRQQTLDRNPRSANGYLWLGTYLTALGRLTDAHRAIDTAIALQPGSAGFYQQLTVIAIMQNDAAGALAAAQHEPPGIWRASALALALQVGADRAAADDALHALIANHAAGSPYQIAEVYAVRGEPDAMFDWLDRAWTTRDAGLSTLLYDPLILRYQRDPRFVALCNKVGLPTTTDAVAWHPSQLSRVSVDRP